MWRWRFENRITGIYYPRKRHQSRHSPCGILNDSSIYLHCYLFSIVDAYLHCWYISLLFSIVDLITIGDTYLRRWYISPLLIHISIVDTYLHCRLPIDSFAISFGTHPNFRWEISHLTFSDPITKQYFLFKIIRISIVFRVCLFHKTSAISGYWADCMLLWKYYSIFGITCLLF